ncbi:hypothetical protein BN133_3380 [Cronobacter dublinensis 582]|nr:hypothetical protein BN133_3380 [Cronobacter dublinensis 582]
MPVSVITNVSGKAEGSESNEAGFYTRLSLLMLAIPGFA